MNETDNEELSNLMIDIETKNHKIHQQNQTIHDLENQEKNITEKKQGIKFIIKYLDCFKQFEKLFMGARFDENLIINALDNEDFDVLKCPK